MCGQRIIQLQAPKGKNVIDQLRQKLKDADDDLHKTETAIASSIKTINRLKQEIEDHKHESGLKKADLDNHWQQVRQLLTQCGKNTDETVDFQQTDSLIESLENDLHAINTTLQQASVLHGQITTERNRLTLLSNAHNQAQIDLNKVNDSIKYQGEAIERSKNKFQELTNELNDLFAMSDWQELSAQNADFIEKLEQRAT